MGRDLLQSMDRAGCRLSRADQTPRSLCAAPCMRMRTPHSQCVDGHVVVATLSASPLSLVTTGRTRNAENRLLGFYDRAKPPAHAYVLVHSHLAGMDVRHMFACHFTVLISMPARGAHVSGVLHSS